MVTSQQGTAHKCRNIREMGLVFFISPNQKETAWKLGPKEDTLAYLGICNYLNTRTHSEHLSKKPKSLLMNWSV